MPIHIYTHTHTPACTHVHTDASTHVHEQNIVASQLCAQMCRHMPVSAQPGVHMCACGVFKAAARGRLSEADGVELFSTEVCEILHTGCDSENRMAILLEAVLCVCMDMCLDPCMDMCMSMCMGIWLDSG